jgi:hypothetical protein
MVTHFIRPSLDERCSNVQAKVQRTAVVFKLKDSLRWEQDRFRTSWANRWNESIRSTSGLYPTTWFSMWGLTKNKAVVNLCQNGKAIKLDTQ